MDNPAPGQIKQARSIAGHTQTQAAETIGYKLRSLQDWESGARKMPPAAYRLYLLLTDQDDEYKLVERRTN